MTGCRRPSMPMNKPHLEFTRVDMNTGWATPTGYPAGIKQKILASDMWDGTYGAAGFRFAHPGYRVREREGIVMLAPDEKLKLSPKPYLSATARFKTGSETPRDFLERCLAEIAALDPKIGAFVNLNLEGARAAADQAP